MAGLLYKEFILNRKNLLIIGAGNLVLSIFLFIPASTDLIDGGTLDSGEAVYTLLILTIGVLLFFCMGSIQQSLFIQDEKKVWSSFITTTPISIRGQVLSKYYFSLLISIATLVYCTLVYGINAVIQGRDSGVTSILIMLFVYQTFLRSIDFPFIVCFGSKNGTNVKVVIFFIIPFAAIIYGLFGDLSIFGTFDEFIEWFTKLLTGELYNDAMLMLIALAPFFTGAMYYFSYKISCKLYLKGAENYDK